MARLNFRPASTPGTANILSIHGGVEGTAEVCVAVTSTGAIYRSTSMPGTWAPPTSPVAAAINDVDFGNSAFIGVCDATAAQRVIRGTGAANTWAAITTTRTPTLLTVATDGAGIWLAGGAKDTLQQIWRSTDNGLTWSAITTPAGMDGAAIGNVNSIAYVTGTTYLCTVSDGGIWKTTDSGANWTQVKTHVAGDTLHQLLVGEARIFCTGENAAAAKFYACEDLTGSTWGAVTPTMPFSDILYYKGAAYGQSWVFPGGVNHTHFTEDDGVTWKAFGTGGYFGIGNAPIANFTACGIAVSSVGAPVYIFGGDGGLIVQSEIPSL